MCWTRAGVHVPPINNPATLFRGLFVNPPQSAREVERTRLKHRASVLDALRDSASALNRTLNAADRNKLDQYLTSVRDVERRLQMSKEWLDRPKPKSPIDEVLDEERQHIDEVALLYDLLALALQTDSTRVATLEVGGSIGIAMYPRDADNFDECPNDCVLAECNDGVIEGFEICEVGMLGNVRTRTLKAFPEAAYREIVASLG